MSERHKQDPRQLRRLYELLDTGLDLDPAARSAWMDQLPAADQALAPRLRELLARASVETDDFMRRNAVERLPLPTEDDEGAQRPGDLVGPYRLLSRLGAGGMATVWLAERLDGTVSRQVALKLPREGWGQGLTRRLARERDILASLEHPLIARLYDGGQLPDGRPWLAMEHVPGSPIDRHCREARLAPEQTVRLFLQVIEAVAFAHARLVVHRDLKPGNVLVDDQGRVRLLDFGVAKLLGSDADEAGAALTRMHGQPITLEYASPEQLRRQAIGVASDVYSLGVILFELLTGQRPYRVKERTREAIEQAVLSDERPRASTMVSDAGVARALRGDLDAILDKALRPDLAQRYASAEAFAADLRRYLDGEPVLARSQTRRYRAAKFVSRYRWPVLGATVVSVSIVGGLGGAIWQAGVAREQAALAQARLRQAEGLVDFAGAVITRGFRGEESLTLNQLLDRSERAIGDALGRRPVDGVLAKEMLAGWQVQFGNPKKARELLQSALAALPEGADAALAERLHCLSAEALGLAGDLRGAVAEFERAMQRPSGDASARIRCEVLRANIEVNLNNKAEALRWAQAAQQTLRRVEQPSAWVRAGVENTLGQSLVASGRPAEGVVHYAKAVDLLQDAGPSQDHTLIFTLMGRAVSLTEAGQHKQAIADLLRAERLASERLPDARVPPALLVNLGNALRYAGRLTPAEDALRRATVAAQRDRLPMMEAVSYLGVAAVELARAAPKLEQVRSNLDLATRLMEGMRLPAGTPARGGERHVRALMLMAAGDRERADADLAEMVRLYDQYNAPAAASRSIAYRAEIALQRGDLDGASTLLDAALDRARRSMGDFATSSAVAGVLILQAEVAARRGQPDDARELARQALRHALASASEEHPAAVKARTLLAR